MTVNIARHHPDLLCSDCSSLQHYQQLLDPCRNRLCVTSCLLQEAREKLDEGAVAQVVQEATVAEEGEGEGEVEQQQQRDSS